MPKHFPIAFAENGERTEIPQESTSGVVNYDDGFGPRYELPKTNPQRLAIERSDYNGLMHAVTDNLKHWQENGYPEIVADDGFGDPLSYSLGFVGTSAGTPYVALVDGTTTVPPSAEWQEYRAGHATSSTGANQPLPEALDDRVLTCTSVESISSLFPSNNQQISLYSYHLGKGYGGGVFIFDSARAKIDHNGGTVISPTVPWDWSDLGEGYLSGAGETDSGGSGCWVRQDNGAPSPMAFGAISETGVDSWPSIHASLENYFKQSLNFYTYFGGGRFLFTGKEYRRTSGLFRKQIHHLHLEAVSGFEGSAVLALTPTAPNVLNDVRLNHSTVKGGPGQNSVSYVDYLILLDQTQGVWIENCELNIAGVACIRDLKDGPGCEVHINDCRISSAAQNNPGAAGVDFAGNDSAIHGGVIRECDPLIRLRSGANSVQHVHLYNFAADKNAWGIEAQDAAMLEIKNNYIDDVRVLLVNPKNMQLTNNKGVVGSALNWTDGPAAFVLIQAGEANFVMHDYIQTDNNFRCRSSENPVSNIARRSSPNNFDSSAMKNVLVKDNVGENCTLRTTHPTVAHVFSSESSKNVDLSGFSIFGPTLPSIYKRAVSGAYSGANFASFRIGIAGSVATVYSSTAVSGTYMATYDCNAL